MLFHYKRIKHFLILAVFFFVLHSSVFSEVNIVLKFGHFAVVDPAVILRNYNPLLNMISNTVGLEVILIQKPTYQDLNNAFINNEIDLGILNSFSYIQIKDKVEIEVIGRRVIENMGTYQSYIIARKDSSINNYADIKGKIFAFSDPNSTSGYLIPKYMLLKNGINIDDDLKKVLFIGKQDSTIYAVLNRTADVAAVASYIYNRFPENMSRNLVIIAKSDHIPLGPVVIRSDLSENIKNGIKDLLLNLDNSSTGLSALYSAGLDEFEDASEEDYRIISEILEKSSME